MIQKRNSYSLNCYIQINTNIIKDNITQGIAPTQLPNIPPAHFMGKINNNRCIHAQTLSRKTDAMLEQFIEKQEVVEKGLYPYSAIGLILFDVGRDSYAGMGFHIGHNVIITSAENCYSSLHLQPTANIRFHPGCGEKYYQAKQVHYPREYIQNISNNNYKSIIKNGFAFIQLETNGEDIQLKYGSLGYNFSRADSTLTNSSILNYLSKEQNYDLTKTNVRINYKDAIITYALNPSCQIMSGAPIVEQIDGKIIANGIHIHSCNNGSGGVGLNMTEQVHYLCLKSIKAPYGTLWQQKANITVQYVQAMIGKNWQYLKTLSLTNCHINNAVVTTMAHANWNQLQMLNLRQNQITDIECIRGRWPNIKQINFSLNKIGLEGCKTLSQCNWIHLEIVQLQQCQINHQGMRQLTTAQWPQLKLLDIQMNRIGNLGIKYLVKADWPNLNTLNLKNNSISDKCMKLFSCSYWPKLIKIDLSENSLTKQGVSFLLKSVVPSKNKKEIELALSKLSRDNNQMHRGMMGNRRQFRQNNVQVPVWMSQTGIKTTFTQS